MKIPRQILAHAPKRLRASKSYRKRRKALLALMDDAVTRDHDYNTSAEAMVDPTVAAFNAVAYELGCTGFQASWAALRAYTGIVSIDGPIIVLRAEEALYPQYDLHAKLDEFLNDDDVQEWLRDKAAGYLADKDDQYTHPAVKQRWLDIVAGAAEASDSTHA